MKMTSNERWPQTADDLKKVEYLNNHNESYLNKLGWEELNRDETVSLCWAFQLLRQCLFLSQCLLIRWMYILQELHDGLYRHVVILYIYCVYVRGGVYCMTKPLFGPHLFCLKIFSVHNIFLIQNKLCPKNVTTNDLLWPKTFSEFFFWPTFHDQKRPET